MLFCSCEMIMWCITICICCLVTKLCPTLLQPHKLWPARLLCPWNSPGQNTGVGISLLQGIFPTQGSNPGLLHCRWILYQLSHKGSPRIQNTGVGSLSLLQGILPTQGSNRGLLHCRWILYQLSYWGSPIIISLIQSYLTGINNCQQEWQCCTLCIYLNESI